MPFAALTWHLIWFVRVPLHVVLAIYVVRRNLRREFPIFVYYILWTAAASTGLLLMNYAPYVSGDEYAMGYVFGVAVGNILSFGVIYEVFRYMLRGYPALRATGTTLFAWATIALLVVVVALAWYSPAQGEGHFMSGLFLLERTINIVMCGLLLFVFLFCGYFGLSRRSLVSGITLGLGILASLGLATTAIRSQIEAGTRNQYTEIMELITQAAFLASVLIWFAYLLLPERTPRTVVKTLPTHDLETWNQELQRLLHQ